MHNGSVPKALIEMNPVKGKKRLKKTVNDMVSSGQASGPILLESIID
jgi:hypothetical protein